MSRISSETAVTSLVDADVLLVDNPTLGTRKVAHSDLKAQYEIVARKGVADGYAALDANGLVPAAQLRPALVPELAATEAAKNALTVVSGDIGKRIVYVTESAVSYLAMTAGAGADKWAPYSSEPAASTSAPGIVQLAASADAETNDLKALTIAEFLRRLGPYRNALAPGQALLGHGTAEASLTLPAAFGTADKTLAFECAIPAADGGLFHVSTAGTNPTARQFIVWIAAATRKLRVEQLGATTADIRQANTVEPVGAVGDTVKVTLTVASGTLAIYVNGISVAYTETTAGTPPAWSDAVNGTAAKVGSMGGASYFVGRLRLIALANRDYSAAEVRALYGTGSLPAADYNRSTVDPTGIDLITNSDYNFSAITGNWTLAGGATISGGKLNMLAGAEATFAPKPLKAGMTYRYSLDVDSSTAAKIWFHDGVDYNILIANTGVTGTHTGTITMVADGPHKLLCEAGASTLDNMALLPLGLLVAPEVNAPGTGPQWCDASGNAAAINLPGDGITGGVTWALPGGTAADFGETRTASGYALGRDAVVIPEGYRIARIWCSGDGTFSIGNAASGAEIVNAFTATAITQPATLSAYVTASRKLYVTFGTATTLTYGAHLERI